jgi:hypothetical protein
MAGESEYTFKHALTRDVAYASLPKAKRARLHADFAAWLERFGEGGDDLAPFLGHHYAEAAREQDADLAWAGEEGKLALLRTKALQWLRRAADLAIGRYEIDEGLHFLARAVELPSDAGVQSELWREIGLANALKYDGEAFTDAMQRSIDLCADRATCGATYALPRFTRHPGRGCGIAARTQTPWRAGSNGRSSFRRRKAKRARGRSLLEPSCGPGAGPMPPGRRASSPSSWTRSRSARTRGRHGRPSDSSSSASPRPRPGPCDASTSSPRSATPTTSSTSTRSPFRPPWHWVDWTRAAAWRGSTPSSPGR